MMGGGGAATSLPVLHFFEDIGIPILEGYGLTETSPTVTAGGLDWSTRRLGCCGIPIKGCEVQIMNPETRQFLGADQEGEVVSYHILS